MISSKLLIIAFIVFLLSIPLIVGSGVFIIFALPLVLVLVLGLIFGGIVVQAKREKFGSNYTTKNKIIAAIAIMLVLIAIIIFIKMLNISFLGYNLP